MRKVAQYCIIDSLHCQELLVNQSTINDYREVASIAYVSLFDTHYYANKIKVQNLLSAYAIKQDMVISTRVSKDIEKRKYSDAYVFLSKKGIMTERPADNIHKNGNELHMIEFKFNKRDIQAWCVRYKNQSEKKRLYPVILEDLSNKRLGLKARLVPLGKKEYSSVCFDYDYWDLKQKALKVYMNTFYGEAGNSLSPIFLHKLACRTTMAGKYNLNLVVEFVSKKGFGIKYGDTDFLYLTCPDRYYKKCDEAFFRKELSKEAYWTEIVKITMNVMKKLRNQ
ncbi:5224_t:CDS:2, partial [Funneliformis geosporum]